MNLYIKLFVLIATLSSILSHTHDEISKCSLREVHKTRQTIIESPNYPNNYSPDTCWDYVIRSPYKCPTTFHMQFLDFYLEHSKDCKNDYLAIGLDNVDDDMDVLCGQVVGIKMYHTPDGVLRLRFFADSSPWTTGKGFKLLVTRLACERDDLFRNQNDADDDDNVMDDDGGDTIVVSAPSENFEPPDSEIMQIFRNLTGQEQYQTVSLPPLFGFNYPTQLPSPPYPETGTVYVPSRQFQAPFPNYPGTNLQNNLQQPCSNDDNVLIHQRQMPNTPNYYGALHGKQLIYYPTILGGSNVQSSYLPSYTGSNGVNQVPPQQAPLIGSSNNGFFAHPRDQYIGAWSSTPSLPRVYDNTIDGLETCCVSAFQQKHFYLSSPGFPRTIFSNILPNLQKRDCVFRVQKSSSNVCHLRLNLKFFDFGQSYQGTGSYAGNIGMPAIQNTHDLCREDFIEIDNHRFCGCRSGYSFTAYWTTAADKKLRMRMGYSGVPSGGFLLELVQEECSEEQIALMTTERPTTGSTLTTINPNLINDQLTNSQQGHQILQGQQQQTPSLNAGSYYVGQQQQLPYIAGVIPTNLQQQNPFLTQQLQQLQPLQNSNLYPSQFGSNYFSYLPLQNLQHNLLQQQALPTNSFGAPQIRYARSYGDQQPVTIVETNSTRKEYYYTDTDSVNYNQDPSSMSRSSSAEVPSKWDRKDINVNERNDPVANVGRQRRKCSFDMGDIFRLSVDILWITKPICYAPQRNWFPNWIG